MVGIYRKKYLQEEEYNRVQCTTINAVLFVAGNCSPCMGFQRLVT